MSEIFQEQYYKMLVENLLWTRAYHQHMVKEIDERLLKLSRDKDCTIPLP